MEQIDQIIAKPRSEEMKDLIFIIQERISRLEKQVSKLYGGSAHPGFEATHQATRDAINAHIGDLRNILSRLVEAGLLT